MTEDVTDDRIAHAGAAAGNGASQQPAHEGPSRRQLLPLSAAAALAAAGLRWAPLASAELGANPVTGTREQLTLAEPTDTEGVNKDPSTNP